MVWGFKKKYGQADPFVIQSGRVRTGRIKRGSGLDWLEEPESAGRGRKESVGKNFDLGKTIFLKLVLAFFFGAVLLRAGWLMVLKGGYYRELAEGNRIRVERLEAERGVIYDRAGRTLVGNTANFLLYLVPADLPKDALERKKIIQRVAEDLPEAGREEIEASLKAVRPGSLESYQPLFVADNIPYDKAMALYLESASLPGVVLSGQARREYNLTGLSLSHILGYTGKISPNELLKFGSQYSPIDYLGKAGLENFWENELKGINGKKQIEVDALGKEKKIISQEAGQDGHNLILSVDAGLQNKLEQSLSAELGKLRLTKACALALDPNNGEILAMVSLPSFNNNDFARGLTAAEYQKIAGQPDLPLFNRCVSGEYPSGSTIKPVIAAAALEENVIDENTTFLSSGGLRLGQWFFPDWKAGGHGLTDVKRALAESINTFFYYIGGGFDKFAGLGLDRMIKYEKLFGLGAQSGVDLPAEASGFLPSKEWKQKTKGEPWYIGDTYHLSIGQGDILVTPLQVADYTAVFANGGSLYRPHLVKEILDGQDNVLSQADVKPVKENLISAKNMEIVRQGLRQTVTSGSAQSLSTLGVSVAGKTGTAQWATDKPTHAWFTGFAPYDKPEIVLTILIEQGGEGSASAVPVARDVLDWWFKNKQP